MDRYVVKDLSGFVPFYSPFIAPNSCSYADLAISPIDDAVFESMKSTYPEMLYYGRYRDDCLSLWCGSTERLNEFFTFLNSLNEDLKFTMEI